MNIVVEFDPLVAMQVQAAIEERRARMEGLTLKVTQLSAEAGVNAPEELLTEIATRHLKIAEAALVAALYPNG